MNINSQPFIPGFRTAIAQTNETTTAVPPGNDLPQTTGTSGKSYTADPNRASSNALSNQIVEVSGDDGYYQLGLMALGQSSLDLWSNKGLEITQETIIAAGKTFQDAFRKTLEEHGSSLAGTSLAMNKHQIVINSQEVPDWFTQEYQTQRNAIDNIEMRNAFDSGRLFFASPPASQQATLETSYNSIAKKTLF